MSEPGRGLKPRPVPPPEIVTLVATAVEECWPRPVVASGDGDAQPAYLRWRFSGRWWAQPTVARRARPWLGSTG